MNPVLIRGVNYTTVPNDFIDIHMKNLSPPTTIVYLVICRKTIGWNKETDSISVSQIMELTGLSKNTVVNSIKTLVEKEFIIKEEVKIGNVNLPNKYDLNLDGFLYKKEGGGAGEEPGVGQTPTGGVGQTPTPQKKYINKKDISPDSPILFDKFWMLYNKKTGKANTIKEWNKIPEDKYPLIIDSLTNYLKDRPDPKFRKDPERYLKHKVYEDEAFNDSAAPEFMDYS